MATIGHLAERKTFELAIRQAVKYVKKEGVEPSEQLAKLVDLVKKLMGDAYSDESYEKAKWIISNPDSKWKKFFEKGIEEIDENVLVVSLLNIGYEAFFRGTKDIRKAREEHDCNVPWLILLDPTSACNLRCTGCWAAEYGHKLNLTYDEIDSIIRQGKELGIHLFMFTGGEPLVRKKDILSLAEKHNDVAFHIYTNGTLIDEDFCKEVQRLGNLSFAISVEGFEEVNDSRRGGGVFQKVMHAFDLMREYGLIFGASICYTRPNIPTITSDEFITMLEEKGCRYAWYFHYMPVGNEADVSLLPSMEQREYMLHKIREIRHDRMLFTMDFQNDGEFVGGCIAGGRNYCHINSNGDVEPCVFIHYSGANIREQSLLECLKQPLFQEYRNRQPFHKNLLRPCPMLENPQILQEMVERSGAHSTDLISPETVAHQCEKCYQYARDWAPRAERIWAERQHPEKKYENFKNWAPKTNPEDWYSNEASLTPEDREDDAKAAVLVEAWKAEHPAAEDNHIISATPVEK
ncbi:MAG: radical SAM protein [Lachnospiraceae bacterium]|nr:radical SAM protein [Lachnospiraceae bacterium]